MSEQQRFEALKARSQMIIGGSRAMNENIVVLTQAIAHARKAIAEGRQRYSDFDSTKEYRQLAKFLSENEATREIKESEQKKIMKESADFNQLVANCERYFQDKEIKSRAAERERNIEESIDSKKRAANTGPTWSAPGSVFAQKI